MKAGFFALAALIFVAGCGHSNATTQQQQTTTRSAGAGRAAGGYGGSSGANGGAYGNQAGGTAGRTRGGAAGNQPPEFPTETAAARHCGGDEVVWLNLKSGVYHAKGTAFYGNTKNGAFACRKEADAAGDRASKAN